MWDAGQYQKFASERARPFFDLLARVQVERAELIVDLGCGPGNLTQTLADRWPEAHVIGVDHSEQMLAEAYPLAVAGRLDFVRGDIRSWSPERPIDLIVSNAAFQWVEGHESLLARLAEMLSPQGTLAVQMPYHFDDLAHRAIEEVKNEPRWRPRLSGVGLHQHSVNPLTWYVNRLHDLGFAVDAWQTTYLHVLTGENPVLEWFKGTALRPLLQAVGSENEEEFLRDMGKRFEAAYPARNGMVLLPFPRIFFVGTRA